MERSSRTYSRRGILAAGGVVAAPTAGCLDRLRSRVARDVGERASVTVKTVPADVDESAMTLARHLASNLDAVGVDTTVTPLAETELRRDVLLAHEFDAYVGRMPSWHDPDFLLSLLHSRYASHPGWQNPFGFADLDVDDVLEAQRERSGAARRRALARTQRAVVAAQPFSVVAFPDEIHAVRTDAFADDPTVDVDAALGVTTLDPDVDAADANHLRFAVTDPRPTVNLNPLGVEFRDSGAIIGLLYDSLAAFDDGDLRPRLAADWSWESVAPPIAKVSLRDGARWHDGTRVTADDVAFTYRFLADTTLGRTAEPVPAPRFQGRVSLVESATAMGDATVRVRFAASDTSVARRAFTVPLLPRHVWRDRTTVEVVDGVDLAGALPPALTVSNLPAVGSGPLRFENADAGARLTLSRYDDHYLNRDDGSGHWSEGRGVSYDAVTFHVVPSDGAAVAVAAAGDVDAVASLLDPVTMERVEDARSLDLVTGSTRSFYHVGFNLRRAPLTNPRFRRVVARLLDREFVAASTFEGYADATLNPLASTDWAVDVDADLSFLGSAGSGRVDVAAARAAFRDAGFRFDRADRLVMG